MLPLNKTMSYLAPSILTTGLFVSTTMIAMPTQGGLPSTSKPVRETVMHTKAESGSLAKNTVLVRNTTPKTEPGVATAPAQKNQEKKTISRCWKRLMNMAREVSHAHRTKSS